MLILTALVIYPYLSFIDVQKILQPWPIHVHWQLALPHSAPWKHKRHKKTKQGWEGQFRRLVGDCGPMLFCMVQSTAVCFDVVGARRGPVLPLVPLLLLLQVLLQLLLLPH